ncbi:MAG: hypothetical protein M3511_15030 [Deinococcota bacterium]|jgi:hypothetical protein|nr:hypothetical protein [Deinococcota bacterium]
MSQTLSHDLDELRRHERWLRGQLAEHARTYLALLEQQAAQDPESDAYATLDGRLYAQIAQLEMSAGDAVRAMDAVTDALPDDDE